jgi:hypothetical protein
LAGKENDDEEVKVEVLELLRRKEELAAMKEG